MLMSFKNGIFLSADSSSRVDGALYHECHVGTDSYGRS
jgi:hypothetical protein